jgi:hypothetical protein
MYEMLLGQSPFRGDDEDEIFDAILEDEPLYPINMSRDAVGILQKVYLFLFLSVLALTSLLILAAYTRPQSPSRFKQDRCGGDQEAAVLQRCQLGRRFPQANTCSLLPYHRAFMMQGLVMACYN